MYKIYINDTPILLMNTQEQCSMLPFKGNNLIVKYLGKSKFLLTYIDMLEKTKKFDSVIIYSEDYERLVGDFKGLFKKIDAAGGVVFNDRNEILVIFRLGVWDLPKGKIDEGENPQEAALREVNEETGINQIELGPLLTETYHTYKNGKGKRILKRTYWYQMKTHDQKLIPQAEENIEIAEWVKLEKFLSENRLTYPSIMNVLSFIQ
jgi:8-oxo-dGTP pyrophosphatase MutT (NUDIX family)